LTCAAITASGPVGIFTDTPSRRLHVVGPAVGTASARFTGPTIDNNWGGHIEFTANNGTLYGGVVASVTGMYLSTGGTTKLSLESAGATFAGAVTASGTISTTSTYVDIGPAAGLRLRHDGANSYLTTSIGTMTVGTTASTSLVVQTASNTRLTVDNVGNFTFLGGKVVFAYTGGITSTGNLTLQNSTTAVLQTIEKTYTSSTSREYIQTGWNATDSAYDVGVSYQGSAGGSLQAVRIGNRTAAGVFSGLTVATSGIVTTTSDLVVTTASGAVTTSVYAGNPQISGAGSLYVTASSGSLLLRSSGTIALLPGNSATGTVYLDASVNFFPNIAGTGNLGTTAKPWLTLTCAAITASGQITTGSAVAGQTYGIQVGNGVAASSDFSYLRFPTNWGNIDFKSWGGALGIYGSGLSLVTAPRFVVDSTGRFGAASGSAFSASTDATLSRASAGVWQMGTTADNALGSLNLANLTASGTILTQNGTSPTSIQITNTYTSATSFGLLDIRANAAQTAYEISSFLGSAGGAALPINIGHRSSGGTFTSALSVATNGKISGTSMDLTGYIAAGAVGNMAIPCDHTFASRFTGAAANSGDIVNVTSNAGHTGRLQSWSRGATVYAAITTTGGLLITPEASVTLATNGQFSIEMTSDTAGNLVYRGSDGTTRRAALVFV
jgi:hypothetical protein